MGRIELQGQRQGRPRPEQAHPRERQQAAKARQPPGQPPGPGPPRLAPALHHLGRHDRQHRRELQAVIGGFGAEGAEEQEHQQRIEQQHQPLLAPLASPQLLPAPQLPPAHQRQQHPGGRVGGDVPEVIEGSAAIHIAVGEVEQLAHQPPHHLGPKRRQAQAQPGQHRQPAQNQPQPKGRPQQQLAPLQPKKGCDRHQRHGHHEALDQKGRPHAQARQ